MATTAERRAIPRALWPEVRSVVMLGMNYGPDERSAGDPRRAATRGAISVYARGRDYHDLIKGKAQGLARWLVAARPAAR